jgi:rhodanese-related sulfurtransferase
VKWPSGFAQVVKAPALDKRLVVPSTGDCLRRQRADAVWTTYPSKSWNTETPILVICRSGGRSSRGSELLASMGFSKVHNMAGGMLSWNAAGVLLPSRQDTFAAGNRHG